MKRQILAFFVLLVALTNVGVVHSETTLIVEKGSTFDYCEMTKETAPVYYAEYENTKTGIRLGRIACLKCVCPKKDKCYPVKTECPDEKKEK